jgi:Ca2+-binding RTX toxin-like protein
MRRAWLLAMAICGLAAAPAHAGVLEAQEDGTDEFSPNFFAWTYTGTPGEANRVWAAWYPATSTLTITDTGAVAMAWYPSVTVRTDTCRAELRRIICKVPPSEAGSAPRLGFNLGDGDDRIETRIPEQSARIDGGDGNDTIIGVAGAVEAFGGAGDDRIVGSPEMDYLDGGLGADRLDGGGGRDIVQYTDHPAADGVMVLGVPYLGSTGVTVSLDGVANDGLPGERDNVLSTNEMVRGSDFDDVLIGSAADDTLAGGPGDDRLTGAAGDDWVFGDDGADHVAGGAGEDYVQGDRGDDVLDLRDGEADVYSCWDGIDGVLADPFDVWKPRWDPNQDCETVEVQP